MGKLQISLACGKYDHTRALQDGTVVPEGIDLNYISLEAEEVFWRMLHNGEFDASEVSLSSYTMAVSRGISDLIAIPVFVSRVFRQSCVYVNAGSGIERPEDLKGKRVGVPEYQITAAVWTRGFLEDDYGVAPRDVLWHTGGLEQPGRTEKIALELPAEIKIQSIPADKTLSQMLDSGEIDALVTARMPSCFSAGSPGVRRLLPNYMEVEADYYQRTGIFPIMHTVAIKRSIYERNPWVAQSLFKAFNQARDASYETLLDVNASHYPLPWMISSVDEVRKSWGDDFWPYGVQKNRKTLEALVRYSFDQGLSRRKLQVEELFAKETLDEFKI